MNVPAMIWIGGTQGAGKSTSARLLAHSHDLPLHRIDSFTYAHVERMAPSPGLDEQLAAGPGSAADAWKAHCRDRLPVILADVTERGLGDVPAIVEGPQLTPALADSIDLPAGAAVWLLTGAARTRRVRAERLGSLRDPAALARLDLLAAREAMLSQRLRRSLAERHRPALEIADDPDWMRVAGAVFAALADALEAAPRLAPGDQLRDQRRYENVAAAAQLRAHLRAIGRREQVPFRFACECGQSGCDLVWEGTPDAYAAATVACAPAHR